ncbi:hypothetical protein A2715_05220 [Candidatus Woesebacteria bacterium RIFCSPHIGHO2_01_FULL_39_32]|uniref:DUF2130 domain-containing protein n=1 Tax=Candidatus Woesebacteria bacterium RIFCSPLOWO2_01_FULL_39_25 TaxID=1802521 RepID=A0A1F8BLW1_9BACT|nr:MAG: hypothetical protein A2124_01360 [Candidatus Woesebacteria bacterium GWB1_37_5]OGM25419.1 MAG: hypothetical protein A2715_05220 [Candidatus Woesebacteria bacterium RIFCSPHIGHO2_01_FULL_39_32]OGM38524.1 MAG: hypothetical protein A3F01_04180 [Candidatus Woesebacteria bacterium RIFCSPHIGHO2_12_FULL_38_11]OGM64950.1 MAG: hypothetical protein A2893_04830 [Candidatus Woesebacteria bacterium RIFCSPLOWO2_01_FULL_39_25]
MNPKFKCPHCGQLIEISEALKQQVEEEVRKNLEVRIKKEFEEKSSTEIEDLKKQLSEKEEKVNELREQELKLREERRKLENREKDLKLELQRQLDEERQKIQESVLKQAVEEHRLKDMEKEKKINDLQAQLEEALRRAKVGSQQLQGEILELDLEETLRTTFPNDEVEPVGKGVKGADVRQIVKSPKGFNCGVILWETKRTKAWKDEWVTKLKSDLRAEKSNIAVIVSSVFPKGVKDGFGLYEGVWIVSYELIIPMATILRKNLLDLGFQKAVSAHKGEKAEYLYEYVTSHEFRQQLEALVEVYSEMQLQLDKEKAAYERIWKSREGQIKRLVTSTANVVGSIQGRVGSSALQIKGLDLPELESGD